MEINSEKPKISNGDIIFAIIFCVVFYCCSFTILFPILLVSKLSPTLNKKFFVYFFIVATKIFSSKITPIRKKMFELLPGHVKNVKLLEVGVGGGANFEYYPENSKVALVDMNENFESEIQERLKKFPNLVVERFVLEEVENMKSIPDSSYDLVLCTHLLCSVRDSNAAVKEIHRVLKKGGNFLFMEHIGFSKWHIGYWIQAFISPLWKIYFTGCTLTRHSDKIIKSYFSEYNIKFIYSRQLPLYVRPHIIGIATK